MSSASRYWSSVSTSTQPVCRDRATHARSSPASEPVWEAAAMVPNCVRPPFRITTGLRAFASRKSSNRRRPSPADSMYMPMTRV